MILCLTRKTKCIGKYLCLNHVAGKKVYNFFGKEIGKIEHAIISGNKIYGWVIKPLKSISKKLEKKKILIKHEYVYSIKDVMILNEKISEFMNKDNKK